MDIMGYIIIYICTFIYLIGNLIWFCAYLNMGHVHHQMARNSWGKFSVKPSSVGAKFLYNFVEEVGVCLCHSGDLWPITFIRSNHLCCCSVAQFIFDRWLRSPVGPHGSDSWLWLQPLQNHVSIFCPSKLVNHSSIMFGSVDSVRIDGLMLSHAGIYSYSP